MTARTHLLFSLAAIVVLSISTHAQDTGPNGSARPVEMNLKATSDKVCLESLLPLELKVTNNSISDLKIQQLDLLRDYTIEYTAKEGLRETAGSLGIWPGTIREEERLRNEVHVLKPAESYTTTYKLPLWYSRAFSRPGKYWLRTYYKQLATSNVIAFEIVSCNSN